MPGAEPQPPPAERLFIRTGVGAHSERLRQ
jgi:hypothetical protein